MQNTYVLIAIVALAVIMLVLIITRKRMGKPLSWLAGLSFIFIIAGLIFIDDRFVGYPLICVGALLAFFDMIKKARSKSL